MASQPPTSMGPPSHDPTKRPPTAPEEKEKQRRVARKLTKKRKDERPYTMEIPKRLEEGDDVEEDCTAPRGVNGAMINQSVFGMIAAAGSQVDFGTRFEGSEDDDEEDENASAVKDIVRRSKDDGRLRGEQGVPGSSSGDAGRPSQEQSRDDKKTGLKAKVASNKLLRSLSHLGHSHRKHKSPSKLPALLSESTSDASKSSKSSKAEHKEDMAEMDTSASLPTKGPPVMGQMLDAREQAASERPGFESRESLDHLQESSVSSEGDAESNLAKRLMEIFQFDEPEKVIEEYPCWLMKSVLLQGYMYITTRHICFYAYLPKRINTVVKSGYLEKRGLRNPKYNRYWFILKGDVLSYYSDPSDKYFPHGNIDLRYGISASLVDKEKTKGSEALHFEVVTHQRKYEFKADSAPSAKEWVKSLQKIIFRSHNEGDSVKISLPIENVIDVEDSQVVEFAETCKIRVIDNDMTYAIDEYFFSFFSFGKDALNVLRTLVEDTAAKKVPKELLAPMDGLKITADATALTASEPHKLGVVQENSRWRVTPPLRTDSSTPALSEVKATLSPIRSPVHGRSPRGSVELSRKSFDFQRDSSSQTRSPRRSMDFSRIVKFDRPSNSRSNSTDRCSFSGTRAAQKKTSETHDGSDSYVHSMEQASGQSASEDTQGSASHILRTSDGFFQPSLNRSISASRHRDETPLATSQFLPPKSKTGHAATGDSTEQDMQNVADNDSTPSLQNLMKAGAYPLQRAAGFANYLNKHSQKMSKLLATESMGYVEKVSGMWKGGKRHYDEPASMGLEEETDEEIGGQMDGGAEQRFHDHFALPESEKLQAAYFGYLHRVLPLYGKVYLSDRSFCYRSLIPGSRTKLILPLKDIENVDKEKGFRFGYSGLVVVVRGHEELFFEFATPDIRDDCCVTLLQNLERIRELKKFGALFDEDEENAAIAQHEHKALQQARKQGFADHDLQLPQNPDKVVEGAPPILFDDAHASVLNFKPTQSLRITCLTIGSRGDVQPYIALCKGLKADGHHVRIATHLEFQSWVESHGIEFAPVDGDPAELMRICIENGMFTYSFLKEASSTFRGWIDDLLRSSWKACQGSDVLIESPSAMAGIHIAEALGIPYFRAFTMPWTRTRAYPHAFAVPEHKMGGAYNYITYVMFDTVFWKAIAGQVNRWRKKELKLGRTSLEKMQPNKVPFLYNFSPSVVVPPLDYSDWIRVTGYWFLDEGEKYEPPKELTDFITKAREDGKKLVYVGFGSIVVADSNALLRVVVDSVLKADVRCILAKGWSDRLSGSSTPPSPLVDVPTEILQIKSAPHDWLFTQVDAVSHHGGAGTTGASLRAGKPTIIRPFFGDQYFFGGRVEDLGVGIYLRKMNVTLFARALWESTHSERMIVKARVLGEQIRSENGVETAIKCIYRDMEYAKSLIKRRPGEKTEEDEAEDIEENWTFIGDENEDSDVLSRVKSPTSPGNGGLDEMANAELERRLEEAMSSVGSLAVQRDEKGARKDVKGQAKMW